MQLAIWYYYTIFWRERPKHSSVASVDHSIAALFEDREIGTNSCEEKLLTSTNIQHADVTNVWIMKVMILIYKSQLDFQRKKLTYTGNKPETSWD